MYVTYPMRGIINATDSMVLSFEMSRNNLLERHVKVR